MNNDKKQNNFIVRLAEEKDTKKIIEFIDRYREKGNVIKESKNVFRNITLPDNYYKDLIIRHNLYNFTEEFILAENNDEIKMLISFGVPTNLSRVFSLNLILYPVENINLLKDMITFACERLPKVSLICPSKIRASIEADINSYVEWVETLKNIGFSYEISKKHEFYVDKSIVSLTLDIILE